MEVAASLPNVLKVFPLRIMAREDFPPFQHMVFLPEASVKDTDKELEEGEIDLNDSCSHEGAHGIFKEQQYSRSNVVVPTSAHNQSNLANELECSVDALLSLPDKCSPQGLSKLCNGQVASQSPLRNHRPFFEKAQGVSPSKPAHFPSPSQPFLSAKQFSSPAKPSAPLPQSSPSNQSRVHILPQASSPLPSSCKSTKASSQFKKLHVLSPKAQQPQISPTADKDLVASLSLNMSPLPFKASSPHADHCSLAGDMSPTRRHQITSLSEFSHSSPAPQSPLVATGKQLLGGLPQTPSPLKQHHHQVPSQPNHSHSLGSVLGKKTLVDPQLTSVQLSPQTTLPVMTQGHGKRAFITCVNGYKRSRSSAVRDYPEGCGKNVSARLHSEQDKSNVCHDKLGFETQGLKGHSQPDRVLTSPTKQVRKEVAPQEEANSNHPVCTMEDRAANFLYKSLKSSVPLPNPQKIPVPLKRKHDARLPPDSMLHQAQKRRKVRPMSRILNSVEERFVSSSPQEKRVQIDWFPSDNHYDCAASAEREVKLQDAKSLKLKPLGGVTFAKKSPKHLEAVSSLLPLETNGGVCARSLVKKTLQEFDCVRRSLAICKDRHQRPDLAAAKILKSKGRWRNCENGKIIGDVPGVEVGDQFSYRIEMLVIGLHRQVQGGIDFILGSERPEGPLATSIVASGGYEDDDDCGDTFIYTGQGGNNYKGDRRQACDQVLQRGNLALSNSCKEKTPVRVIRGSTDDKFYTYDGLYDVVKCWFQTGASGFGVYQFMLSRRPGQPELGSSIVRFMGTVKKKGLVRPHVLMGDLSYGKETLPVCVVNEVDDELAPQYFSYIPKMKYPSWYCPEMPKGCDCVGGCVDASKCLCAAKNGGEFPYNESGQIVTDNKVVFECGQSCACLSSCHNRVSQRSARHMLEVFKTRNRGWGVRSLEPIRTRDFICEYSGELLSDADAEQRIDRDEYLFDIGNKVSAWSDVSDLMGVVVEKAIVPVVEDVGYTIDARLYGNVARFVNHSCSPNLYAQNVVYDGNDLKFPHVILFAMENVPPMRELSYDYNYTIGHVRDANGNVKSKACYCGAQDCRGRLY